MRKRHCMSCSLLVAIDVLLQKKKKKKKQLHPKQMTKSTPFRLEEIFSFKEMFEKYSLLSKGQQPTQENSNQRLLDPSSRSRGQQITKKTNSRSQTLNIYPPQ